jgi:hypothetical protein
MNSLQIVNVLTNDIFSKKFFKKVYAIDQIPNDNKKYKNAAFIINTDKKTGKGEHWLAVFYDKNNNSQFFDSLGFGPEFYGLSEFLLKTSKNSITNKFGVQSFLSEYCGFYSILFIMIRSRNISFQKFLEFFNEDTIKNDLKIENLIKTFI